MKLKAVFVLCVTVCFVEATTEKVDTSVNLQQLGRQLVEEGRTLVHHTLKRFMIILPAIFFKLGIAFTLLVLVALAAVNNGFIGFLILVVGLSSVLARLQDSGRAVPVPYISPVSPYHHQVWDRSDVVQPELKAKAPLYHSYGGQNADYGSQLANYYAKYTTAKM
ncbi:hypothetical protein Zmor_028260 [Zophobas morio]|uniref:Uncharacterized protein n=1 Tax=Zophobas morio TaxID=2755281 RepID=A0AA38M441_9CUCU|nr:hypothetical protein Zmor_028260 [Zophobas morio]